MDCGLSCNFKNEFMKRRDFIFTAGMATFATLLSGKALAQTRMDLQPFVFQTLRLLEALEFLGTPIPASDKSIIETAVSKNDDTMIGLISEIL